MSLIPAPQLRPGAAWRKLLLSDPSRTDSTRWQATAETTRPLGTRGKSPVGRPRKALRAGGGATRQTEAASRQGIRYAAPATPPPRLWQHRRNQIATRSSCAQSLPSSPMPHRRSLHALCVEPRPHFARVIAPGPANHSRLWKCLVRSSKAVNVGNADAEEPRNFLNGNAEDFECRIHGISLR